MIKLLLTRFWIVLMPFLFYGLWLIFITHKTKSGHYVGEHLRKAALFWSCAMSAILLIGCCIWWAVSQAPTGDAKYTPAQNVNGKLIPSQISQ
jgi:uncharacterized iron-regulated membrane protein